MVFLDFRHELSLFLTKWPPAHNQFFCYDIFPFWRRVTTNWKILKEMGIPDHLIFFLRNLYAGQEATVRTRHGTTGSKLGKDYNRAVYCHPVYLTCMQSSLCEVPGWMKKHKLESKFMREILTTSDMQMTPPLWQKTKWN